MNLIFKSKTGKGTLEDKVHRPDITKKSVELYKEVKLSGVYQEVFKILPIDKTQLSNEQNFP